MADFCHDYDPGGLGGDHPMGDFNWAIERHKDELKPGYEILLGICEGHGSGIYLSRDDNGTLWFEHGPGYHYIENEKIVVPEPKRIEEDE